MSKMALNLIRQAKAEKWKSLDLGSCGIVGELPAEMAELVDLEELILGGSWWDAVTGTQKWSRNIGPKNEIVALGGSLPPNLAILVAQGLGLRDCCGLALLASLRKLDLSVNKVADIGQLANLQSLTKLNLSRNQVADIGPLAGLTNLDTLDLGNNQTIDVAPLAGLINLNTLDLKNNQLGEIAPLAGLINLNTLDLKNNQLGDIGPLAGLINLDILDLEYNQLAEIGPLAELINLVTLDLYRNQVTDIGPLAKLLNLNTLDLSQNKVADIGPLAALINLAHLKLSENKIVDISPLLSLFKNNCRISLGFSTIQNPPPEIFKKGKEAIISFLEEQQKRGQIRLLEAKVLLVGEGGAGKTSLLWRMFQPQQGLPQTDASTRGIEVHLHDFPIENKFEPIVQNFQKKSWLQRILSPRTQTPAQGGNNMRLNVWDFGGQQIYHSTHQFFLTKRSVYVLIDDARVDDSTRDDDGFKHWLEMVELKCADSPILIFQNIKAGRTKALGKLGIQKRFRNVIGFFEGNLAEKDAAKDVLVKIKEIALSLPHVGQIWPRNWYDIRMKLEEIGRKKPYIAWDEYLQICENHQTLDRTKALELSQFLHDLGVILHFQNDETLQKIVILQNKWATDAVFRVLDSEKIKTKNGHFNIEDCAFLWSESTYRDCHRELRQLMMNFDLCYELLGTKVKTWLVPQLLEKEPSGTVMEPSAADTFMYYEYESAMPVGLVNRLMVRRSELVLKPDLAWKTGVLFENATSQVLVDSPFAVKRIQFRAKGPDANHLLSILTHELETLNATFEGLGDSVKKMVPCNCDACKTLATPFAHDYSDLIRNFQANGASAVAQCKTDFKFVKVADLLNSYPLWPTKTASRGAEFNFNVMEEPAMKKVFISYSKSDTAHLQALEAHLSVFKRNGLISTWNCRKLVAGEKWDGKIQQELEEADIILFLVSSDFLATDYIWDVEIKRAVQRDAENKAKVVPIIVRSCVWEDSPLGVFNSPEKAAVIDSALNADEAWTKVVRALEVIIKK